jgi:serine/threonine-protein kinase
MRLSPGTRLGPYEVIGSLGAGGMGEVYRGRDTKLHREVALKILPDEFAHDAERLARFQREAQVLAALNHPNIAQIYAVEDLDAALPGPPRPAGSTTLVMELVEGPTLAERIARGPVPIADALEIAGQIAQALEAAHEQGIVHRDLKPANIKVRPDGTVKVLDFGLAKPTEAAQSSDAVESPTLTSPAVTGQSVILGTAAYMSPEQARGKAVTPRADIWAFGCVLYEMLTGQRMFAGEDVSETLAFVLAKDPDWTRLPAGVPAPVRALLRQCLQRDPKLRLRDIGFARLGLQSSSDVMSGVHVPPAAFSLSRRSWGPAAAVALLVGIGLGWLTYDLLSRPEPLAAPPALFVETLPEGRRFPVGTLGTGTLLAISPDGRRLVYSADEGTERKLFLRSVDRIDQRTAVQIGDVNAREPFFSHDGRWVGFRSDGTVKRMSVDGGLAQPIVELPAHMGKLGTSWHSDGSLFIGGGRTGLLRVSPSGGTFETLITPSEGRSIWYPQLLPGGRTVLYTESPERPDAGELRLFDLHTRTSKVLRRGAAGRYLSSGHLVFVANQTLWALRFDMDRLETRGTAVPMLTGIRVDPEGGAVNVVIGDGGTLAYVPSIPLHRTLVWVDRRNVETPLEAPPQAYSNPRVSPDGTRILVTMRDGGQDVFVWDITRRVLRQLTNDEVANNVATWVGNDRVAFSAQIGASVQIFLKNADGSNQARQLTDNPNGVYPFSASRDERLLFVTQYPQQGGPANLAVIPVETPDRRRVMNISGNNPAILPAGRWLAYHANGPGGVDVYVLPFPEVDPGGFQLTHGGGRWPSWSDDGTELYYATTPTTGEMSIHAVPVKAGPPSGWGQPRRLITGRYSQVGGGDRPYDVHGDRFLVMKEHAATGSAPRQEIIVVLNFLDELRRRVPAD